MQLTFLMPLLRTSSYSSWSLKNHSILNNSTTISCLSPNSFRPKREHRQGWTAWSWYENLSSVRTEDSTAARSGADGDHQVVASLGSSFPSQEASVLLRRHSSISRSQTQRGRRMKGCVSFPVLLWVFYLFLRSCCPVGQKFFSFSCWIDQRSLTLPGGGPGHLQQMRGLWGAGVASGFYRVSCWKSAGANKNLSLLVSSKPILLWTVFSLLAVLSDMLKNLAF